MKRKHMYAAIGEALVLTDVLLSRLPECCRDSVPRDVAFGIVWPLAVRLTRLERQARKDGKAAAAYRRARAEAAQMLAARPDSPARTSALPGLVPFDPECWHVELVPGAPVTELEAA